MHGNIGTMEVMDRTGHTTVTWDPENPDSVRDAEREFNRLRDEGYSAFRMEAAGDGVVVEHKGERIERFDPAAGKVMMVPQLRGG
jgi:hypothetical protein